MEELNPTKVQELFKNELTQQVANGWHIEIQNEFDAVLSKKRSFNWIPHIVVILFGLFIFVPLAIFWLFVMIIVAVTQRTNTKRVWIDPEGQIKSR